MRLIGSNDGFHIFSMTQNVEACPGDVQTSISWLVMTPTHGRRPVPSNARALWFRAAALVRDNAAELQTVDDYRQLRRFARRHGFADEAAGWVRFRTELRRQLGIDYDELRERAITAATGPNP